MQNQQQQKNRAFWLKHLYRWHWISSAACLVGMLLFAVTGITLNNATHIESQPLVSTKTAMLPAVLLTEINAVSMDDKSSLPKATADWLSNALGIVIPNTLAEWSEEEVYLSLPRPGGDAWLTINRINGEVNYELTQRGWISYLNDLHKGRNTGSAWSWFLDVFSVAALIFSITGLCMLYMHANNRPSTWPLVGFGLVLPLVLVILFIH